MRHFGRIEFWDAQSKWRTAEKDCALSGKAAFGTLLGVVLLSVFLRRSFTSSSSCVVNVTDLHWFLRAGSHVAFVVKSVNIKAKQKDLINEGWGWSTHCRWVDAILCRDQAADTA